MTPEEYTTATEGQSDEYANELAWVRERGACKASLIYLQHQFVINPSAFNWVELEQAMARYQNITINITWKEE